MAGSWWVLAFRAGFRKGSWWVLAVRAGFARVLGGFLLFAQVLETKSRFLAGSCFSRWFSTGSWWDLAFSCSF